MRSDHQHATVPLTTVSSGKRSYLVNPLNAAFSLDQKLTAAVGVSFEDTIYIPDGATQKTYQYNPDGCPEDEGKTTKRHWYRQQTTRVSEMVERDGRVIQQTVDRIVDAYDSPVVKQGVGFYYWRVAVGDLTFSW